MKSKMEWLWKHASSALIALALCLPGVSSAAYDVLTPGGFVIPGYSPIDCCGQGGTNLATPVTFGSSSFVADGGGFTGTIFWGVWTNDANNPFGSSNYSFAYAVQNDSTSTDSIDRFNISGFSDVGVAVGWMDDFGTVVPDLATRGVSDGGDVIGWNFFGGILPGFATEAVLIFTDRNTIFASTVLLQNGDQASTTSVSPVPEPEIYAMMAAGLGLMGFVARRRQRKSATA